MYNHWQKKWALSLGLLAVAMLPAGCGNSIDDQFPFGKNRIHCDGETITVATPFELISNGKQVDLADRQAETVHAEGHNANMQILVTGTKASEGKDAKMLAEEAKRILADNPNLKNVKSQQKEITLGDVKAQQLSFSFTETARGKSTELSVEEYIFLRKGVIWRVIYQYRSHDEVGKALVQKVAGQIAMGSTF